MKVGADDWVKQGGNIKDLAEGPASPLAAPRFATLEVVEDSELFPSSDEEDEEQIEYEWEGFIVKGSVATLLGAKKVAKSWLMLLLAVSATRKEPLVDGLPHGGQNVLIVSGPMENSARETRRRVRAVRRHFGIMERGEGDGELQVLAYRTAVLKNEEKDQRLYTEFLNRVVEFRPTILMMDSTGALWGGKSGSDNDEVRTWMEKRIGPLQGALPGVTIILCAHTGHPTRVGKQVFNPDHQRGASAWGDATDTTIKVDKVSAPTGAAHGTAAAIVYQTFTRFGSPSSNRFLFTIAGGPGTPDQVSLLLAPMDEATAVAGASHPVRIRAIGEALAAVKAAGEAGLFQAALTKKMVDAGHRETAVKQAIRTLKGEVGYPWPDGTFKGERAAVVVVEPSRVNPETKHRGAWLRWKTLEELAATKGLPAVEDAETAAKGHAAPSRAEKEDAAWGWLQDFLSRGERTHRDVVAAGSEGRATPTPRSSGWRRLTG